MFNQLFFIVCVKIWVTRSKINIELIIFQGFKRLYPQHFDRRRELRKLNHSLLVNFLDLLDLLIQCPDSPRRAEKVEDISLLFIHIHHLLNEFRPHQARETVRVMLDLQRRQRNETTIRLQKHIDRVKFLYEILVLWIFMFFFFLPIGQWYFTTDIRKLARLGTRH